VSARLYLTDRRGKLIDGGIDIPLRIGNLPDFSAVEIRVGEGRPGWVAGPGYLRRRPATNRPADRAVHTSTTMSDFGLNAWSFPPLPGSGMPRTIHFTPRLVVNSFRGAVESAIEGFGVTRVYLCQIAEQVRKGELEILLADDEETPIPVQMLAP